MSQEPTLYAGTVRFNILLGAIKPESEVTEEEIEKACRDANILDFIQSLPKYTQLVVLYVPLLTIFRVVASTPKLVEKDLNSPAGKNVGPFCWPASLEYLQYISERIAIARALLRNPKVLLLDEVSTPCTPLSAEY